MSVWLGCDLHWLTLVISTVVVENQKVSALHLPLVKRFDRLMQLDLALCIQRQEFLHRLERLFPPSSFRIWIDRFCFWELVNHCGDNDSPSLILPFGCHKNPELGAVSYWYLSLNTFTGPWWLFIKRAGGESRQAIILSCDVATLLLSCDPV